MYLVTVVEPEKVTLGILQHSSSTFPFLQCFTITLWKIGGTKLLNFSKKVLPRDT